MIWVRRGTVLVLSLVLFGSLLAFVGSINFQRNLGSANNVKTMLADSGFYDQVVAIALDEAQEQRASAGPTSIPLSDVIVQQAAKQAFTPQLIQENAEKVVDANYQWLTGAVATPSFTVDLSSAKQTFADRVGLYIEDRLSKLSTCTPEQFAQIQQPINPLAIPCLPEGVTPQSAADQAVQELLTSNFIDTPVITATTLGREENSKTQPYYAQVASAPDSFQLAKKMPLIQGVVILICVIGIVFISLSRRKGMQRIAFVFFLTGFVLITTSLFTSIAVEAVAKQFDNGVSAQLQEPKESVLEYIATQFTRVNFWSGIVAVILAVLIFGYLVRTRGKSGGQLTDNYHKAAAPGSTVEPSAAAAPKPAQQPGPKSPPIGAGSPSRLKTTSRPMTATPSPQKRPPRPRGPRLIQ